MSEDRKREIIRKIKSLQTEQDELIAQLQSLNINNINEEQDNTNNNNKLKVGDPVIIFNPGRFQERSGKICKIGKQVTIVTKKGRKIVRAKKNVQKLE
jgi:NCAIR mutase (PurE)-related protein